ncbi:CPBP family intramembrane glutamic endopeptidase [Ottowia testudinis]|uniref:CPBP family intramembrane metalloprotease n=1 Tax=Ottowia testudinis TaxID=2816950 RepID=A0A975CK32_9BURK|nr:CPBP family intramembrane glutamic endopeptidase [Ottowia testudinis]QTD45644.1 CPBP family intramembrane metalloprotease [Ottowia testudinis]
MPPTAVSAAPLSATAPRWSGPRWPWWVFLLAVVLVFIKDLPVLLVGIWGGPDWVSQQAGALITMGVLLVLALCAALAVPGRLRADHLGLRRAAPAQIALWTGVALAAMYGPMLLGNALGQDASQDVSGMLGHGLANDLALVLAISVVGPVAEEFAHRAVLLRAAADALARWLPPRAALAIAMLVSSSLFMVVHVGAPPWQMATYFLIALALSAAYAFTGSLLAPLVPHLLNNAYASVTMAWSSNASLPVLAVALLSPVLGLALAWAVGKWLGWAKP